MKLPEFIRKFFLKKAVVNVIMSRKPDFKIGPENDPYMERWFLIPHNHFFNIYLHYMHHDDDDVLHDHPWKSLSFILSAPQALIERYATKFVTRFSSELNESIKLPIIEERQIQEGQIVYRNETFAHQLIVPTHTITLFFTWRTVREWGFYCPNGWKNGRDYVNVRDNVSTIGRGCGDV